MATSDLWLTCIRKNIATVHSKSMLAELIEVVPLTSDEQAQSFKSYIIKIDGVYMIGKSPIDNLSEEWNEYLATKIDDNTYEAMGQVWKVVKNNN